MKTNKIVIVIAFVLVILATMFIQRPSSQATVSKLSDKGKVLYFSALYKLYPRNVRSEFMKNMHEATKTRVSQRKNAYSFLYKPSELQVVKNDSIRCRACHGNMKQKVNGKPKYPIHNKMLSVKLIKIDCTNCHKKVDLSERRTSKGTIKVDRGLCTKCHEPKGRSALKYSTDTSWINATFMSRVQSEPNLMSSHGVDKKSAEEWINKHFLVAKAIGIKKCQKCHIPNSELDFCEDCHIGERFEK